MLETKLRFSSRAASAGPSPQPWKPYFKPQLFPRCPVMLRRKSCAKHFPLCRPPSQRIPSSHRCGEDSGVDKPLASRLQPHQNSPSLRQPDVHFNFQVIFSGLEPDTVFQPRANLHYILDMRSQTGSGCSHHPSSSSLRLVWSQLVRCSKQKQKNPKPKQNKKNPEKPLNISSS